MEPRDSNPTGGVLRSTRRMVPNRIHAPTSTGFEGPSKRVHGGNSNPGPIPPQGNSESLRKRNLGSNSHEFRLPISFGPSPRKITGVVNQAVAIPQRGRSGLQQRFGGLFAEPTPSRQVCGEGPKSKGRSFFPAFGHSELNAVY